MSFKVAFNRSGESCFCQDFIYGYYVGAGIS